jgi:hypothetical protein
VICPVNVKEKVEIQKEKTTETTQFEPIANIANIHTQPATVVSNPSGSYYQTA